MVEDALHPLFAGTAKGGKQGSRPSPCRRGRINTCEPDLASRPPIMTKVSNLTLLDVLRQTQLLTSEQLEVLMRSLPARPTDPRALARAMLQRGWLNVYQINQLLAGRGLELVIGPYHVLDRLGAGGQSTVYKARHVESGLVVALKVIKAELLDNPEAAAQFLQEMEAMATLDHPNVVQFYDADKVGETYYCALEYVEGTDLGKYVRLTGPLPVQEACDYIRQTALGLQHAHERNLIHRDIKPVNLFLTGEAEPGTALPRVGKVIKILDWGLASLRPPKGHLLCADGQANSTKVVIGTADYLSPEQAMNPDKVDIRGDIYSLGCTFYYLLTGQPPFPTGTLMQKILQHQKDEPTPVESIRSDLPFGLAGVLKRMMAKKPESRYQTPAAVALALKPYCKADSVFLCRRSHHDTPQTPRTDHSAPSTFIPRDKADTRPNSVDTAHR